MEMKDDFYDDNLDRTYNESDLEIHALLFDDYEWEDRPAIATIRQQYPGWYLMKIINYSAPKLAEIEKWLEDNTRGRWARIGWSSGCAYTVGLAFENDYDTLLYKLQWQ
jgi:hypothetical protein